MPYDFMISKKLILEPQPGSPWAEEMVLNPAIIQDQDHGRIHMLFRATGPWPDKQLPGKPLPYPIFLGYAFSEDQGETWQPDFSRPALAPQLAFDLEQIYIRNATGDRVVNYANGCIEDPRLFWFEGQCHVIVAARLMPPGPYWIHDEPTQCAPGWIKTADNPFGRAAAENVTSNVIYRVDLPALAAGRYEKAFAYLTHLTNPEYGENRDVVLFPEKLVVNGTLSHVCLHRPAHPHAYQNVSRECNPSIMICAASRLEDIWREEQSQTLLASPLFPWEANRIGASTTPLKISPKEWLLCYHGKQDDVVGYTQSFMILEEQDQGLPRVKHRCSERLIIADQEWEKPRKFKTPCVFITGMIPQNGTLLVSYGAADEKVGIARLSYSMLVDYVRRFNAQGLKNI